MRRDHLAQGGEIVDLGHADRMRQNAAHGKGDGGRCVRARTLRVGGEERGGPGQDRASAMSQAMTIAARIEAGSAMPCPAMS
ncbi:hypothetical protein MASR1M49_26150 [Pararhodobacter aggregans]